MAVYKETNYLGQTITRRSTRTTALATRRHSLAFTAA
jgi:hypothetical protein